MSPAAREATPEADPQAAVVHAQAVARWRHALAHEDNPTALVDITVLGDTRLDLTGAHPSGIAQLYAGRTTPLSNLVREQGALAKARAKARAVRLGAEEFSARYGLPPAHLAMGVASWRSVAPDGLGPAIRTRVPVLLRPVTLTLRGKADIDLTLEPSVEVNPVLLAALRARDADVDPDALARLAFTGAGFNPRDALDKIGVLGEGLLEEFSLRDSLIVATFHHPDQLLVDDLDAARGWPDHPVVAALAGVPGAAEALRGQVLPAPIPGDRPPQAERGIGDLDPAQQHALDVVAAGIHAFIDAAPGAGVAETIAALIADATASGRRVLYVAGHRRATEAVERELSRWGVRDLVLDLDAQGSWQAEAIADLMGGFDVHVPEVDNAAVQAVRQRLVESRGLLSAYVTGLHTRREPWGVSAYEALQALADTTAVRPAPRTQVRLATSVTETLIGGRRSHAKAQLMRCAQLGGFTLRPVDTPWFDADITTNAEAKSALETLARLRRDLPRVVAQMRQVAADTGLETPTTLDGWGEQLDMLIGIRKALDDFRHEIFEKSAMDMVAATATKAWREEHGYQMSSMLRRRLRKQARDLLRPGSQVSDLHRALLQVQEQREIWVRWCPAGAWPKLPDGMAAIDADYRAVAAGARTLGAVIADTPVGGDLGAMEVGALSDTLDRLAAAGESLHTLPERTRLLRALRDEGLGPLVDDLRTRRAVAGSILLGEDAIHLIGAELDLAWWSSVLEAILGADPVLASFDGAGLAGLTEQFVAADLGQLATLPAPVMAAVFSRLAHEASERPDQVRALLEARGADRVLSPRQVFEQCPDLVMRLRPCWMTGPMLVPQVLPPTQAVDLVILDAVQHLDVARAVAAIGRAAQVVVVGDPVRGQGSVVGELAAVLPSVPLVAGVQQRDPRLTSFLSAHGYDGLLEIAPLPARDTTIALHLVEGIGLPAKGSSAVESVRAEIEAVVALVARHAATYPRESLAVATASATHAGRVRDAVNEEARSDATLRAWLDAQRDEPFIVVDLTGAGALSRDAVIFSLGFGKTPHGRVLHTFGDISAPGGAGMLLDALLACRGRLDVVSCLAAGDLDSERLRTPGPQLLADLLAFAADPVEPPSPPVDTGESLLTELAENLYRRGLLVEREYTGHGGRPIPLAVGHPALPDRLLVAVLNDDADFVAEPSVRVRSRLRAGRLEQLGWTVYQVWTAAIFLDLDAEANAIEQAVLQAARRLRPDMSTAFQVSREGATPETPGTLPSQPTSAPGSSPSPDAGPPADS